MVDAADLPAARQAARTLVWLAAGLLALAFTWFAYVDAPLVEAAMLLFAAGTASAAVAIMAALYSIEATLQQSPANPTAPPPRRGAHSRRLALLCLALALLLLLGSATLTLGLQGQGGDQQDDTTVST
jgi:hypothetical protein